MDSDEFDMETKKTVCSDFVVTQATESWTVILPM